MSIVFFTPYLDYSGSAYFLINLLEHISTKRSDWKITLITFSEYSPTIEIPKNVEVFSINNWLLSQKRLDKRLLLKLKLRAGHKIEDLFINYIQSKFSADLFYINTIANIGFFKKIKKRPPIILHIHEMVNMLHSASKSDIDFLINKPQKTICVSKACKEGFQALGVKNINIINPTINLEDINLKKDFSIRRLLNLHNNTFIWYMSGALDFNKNPILFVKVLKELIAKHVDVHFIWVGGNVTSVSARIAQAYAKKHQIQGYITFMGQQTTNYYNIISQCNGFFLTSGYESFSIVTLEALYFQKHIICTDCGGVKDIIDESTGTILDTLNPLKIADLMIEEMKMLRNPNYKLNQRKKALSFNTKTSVNNIVNIIQSIYEDR